MELWQRVRARAPSLSLGVWPTPVHRMDGVERVAGGVEPWVKREDLSSPLGGGNKVRKLELLLAGPPRPVLTAGAVGSHHVLATAIHGARVGRPCVGVLLPQPMSGHVAATERMTREACVMVLGPDRLATSTALSSSGVRRLAAQIIRGRGITVIPPGGSSPLGTLGYVGAGLELADQIGRGDCPEPSSIYLALGTGGTAVGLALGLALAGIAAKVVAVRVATRLVGNAAYLRILAERTSRLAGVGRAPAMNLEVRHEFSGAGYGRETEACREAMERSRGCGLPLEPTYTGKALAALLADARSGRARGIVMFLDTYGPMDDVEMALAADGRRTDE
jgi:D-cysteine desulfhydrase